MYIVELGSITIKTTGGNPQKVVVSICLYAAVPPRTGGRVVEGPGAARHATPLFRSHIKQLLDPLGVDERDHEEPLYSPLDAWK